MSTTTTPLPPTIIEEAPIFHPTLEQWNNGDPIAYLEQLAMGEGGRAGICKIVPPTGWQPPFQLSNMHHKIRFKTRVQEVSMLEGRTRVVSLFFERLRKFNFENGKPFPKSLIQNNPKLGLECYHLFKLIAGSCGGLSANNVVTRYPELLCSRPANEVNPRGLSPMDSLTFYRDYLHDFEVFVLTGARRPRASSSSSPMHLSDEDDHHQQPMDNVTPVVVPPPQSPSKRLVIEPPQLDNLNISSYEDGKLGQTYGRWGALAGNECIEIVRSLLSTSQHTVHAKKRASTLADNINLTNCLSNISSRPTPSSMNEPTNTTTTTTTPGTLTGRSRLAHSSSPTRGYRVHTSDEPKRTPGLQPGATMARPGDTFWKWFPAPQSCAYLGQVRSVTTQKCRVRFNNMATEDNPTGTGLGGEDWEEDYFPQDTFLFLSCGSSKEEAKEALLRGVCQTCNRAHEPSTFVNCDGCRYRFHTKCLSSQHQRYLLAHQPNGEWFCDLCMTEGTFPDGGGGVGTDNDDDEQEDFVATSLDGASVMTKAIGLQTLAGFGFDDGETFSMEEYQHNDVEFRHRYFGNNKSSQPIDEETMEREFWKIVKNSHATADPTNTRKVLVSYGNDLDTGALGSGFPKDKTTDDPYVFSSWNLNNLPTARGSLLQYVQVDISGVIVPWLYLGMTFSAFCYHVEDHNFSSINYHHRGAPKSWWGVPCSSADAFEAAARDLAPELFEARPDLLQGIVTMFDPNDLVARGVHVVHLVQRPGDFVVTFPRAYHGGFNHGFNAAEAVNFATPHWLSFGLQASQRYASLQKTPVIAHEAFVVSVAKACLNGREEASRAARFVVGPLKDLIAEEQRLRKQVEERVVGGGDDDVGVVDPPQPVVASLDSGGATDLVKRKRGREPLVNNSSKRTRTRYAPSSSNVFNSIPRCEVCKKYCSFSYAVSRNHTTMPNEVMWVRCLIHARQDDILHYTQNLDELTALLTQLEHHIANADAWMEEANHHMLSDDMADYASATSLLARADTIIVIPPQSIANIKTIIDVTDTWTKTVLSDVLNPSHTRAQKSIRCSFEHFTELHQQFQTLRVKPTPEVGMKFTQVVDQLVALRARCQNVLDHASSSTDFTSLMEEIKMSSITIDFPERKLVEEAMSIQAWSRSASRLCQLLEALRDTNSMSSSAIHADESRATYEAIVRVVDEAPAHIAASPPEEYKLVFDYIHNVRSVENTVNDLLQGKVSLHIDTMQQWKERVMVDLKYASPMVEQCKVALVCISNWVAKVGKLLKESATTTLEELEACTEERRSFPYAICGETRDALDNAIAGIRKFKKDVAGEFCITMTTTTGIDGEAFCDNLKVLCDAKFPYSVMDKAAVEDGAVTLAKSQDVPSSSSSSSANKKAIKYCLCRMGERSVMISCDACSEWFHADCVGLDPAKAEEMTEYTCPRCCDKRILYCVCRCDSNDKTDEMMIQCEGACQEWFHTKCVGIKDEAVQGLAIYLCPSCTPDTEQYCGDLGNQPRRPLVCICHQPILKTSGVFVKCEICDSPFHARCVGVDAQHVYVCVSCSIAKDEPYDPIRGFGYDAFMKALKTDKTTVMTALKTLGFKRPSMSALHPLLAGVAGYDWNMLPELHVVRQLVHATTQWKNDWEDIVMNGGKSHCPDLFVQCTSCDISHIGLTSCSSVDLWKLLNRAAVLCVAPVENDVMAIEGELFMRHVLKFFAEFAQGQQHVLLSKLRNVWLAPGRAAIMQHAAKEVARHGKKSSGTVCALWAQRSQALDRLAKLGKWDGKFTTLLRKANAEFKNGAGVLGAAVRELDVFLRSKDEEQVELTEQSGKLIEGMRVALEVVGTSSSSSSAGGLPPPPPPPPLPSQPSLMSHSQTHLHMDEEI